MPEDNANDRLKELLRLAEESSHFIAGSSTTQLCEHYRSAATFDEETRHLFQAEPFVALHASELPTPSSFVAKNLLGTPLLFTRNQTGELRVFHNVCRHRGAELVGQTHGCKQRFTCPYHAWTYSAEGKLLSIPQEAAGFPSINKEDFGLRPVQAQEYAGWVWIQLGAQPMPAIKDYLGELADELSGFSDREQRLFASDTLECEANWKLIVEGGLEAYHFKVAHKESIAPYFLNNLSSYARVGRHLRSLLPRSTLDTLRTQPEATWQTREHCNVLYTLFPANQFLVQSDHYVWTQLEPLSESRTRVRIATVIPRYASTDAMQRYWESNHALTMKTLREDFALGEGIQRGINAGSQPNLTFGAFESALEVFNQTLRETLAARGKPV